VTQQWQEIHGFGSPTEYQAFERWLEEQVKEGQAEELPVLVPYGMPYSSERWVRRSGTSTTWRLIGPDYPFRGIFLPVDDQR